VGGLMEGRGVSQAERSCMFCQIHNYTYLIDSDYMTSIWLYVYRHNRYDEHTILSEVKLNNKQHGQSFNSSTEACTLGNYADTENAARHLRHSKIANT